MYCIDKLQSNGHNFQIFYFDKNTDIEELNIFNYGYLVSARYFATSLQTEKQCEQIIEYCFNDILDKFFDIVNDNQELYKHFNANRRFTRKAVQSSRENGREYVIYYDVYLNLQLIKD